MHLEDSYIQCRSSCLVSHNFFIFPLNNKIPRTYQRIRHILVLEILPINNMLPPIKIYCEMVAKCRRKYR